MVKKAKIINIMPDSPHYALFWDEPKPDVTWDMPDGKWVGIWGLDWLDLIGYEVLELTDEFEYEVWQPDLRVDRIYSHTFRNGVIHRLFPAKLEDRIYGLKKRKAITSRSICESLSVENGRNNIILRVEIVNDGIGRAVLRSSLTCPVIAQFWGEFRGPLYGLFQYKLNVPGKICDIREHFVLKRLLKRVDVVTCSDERSRRNLEKYYNGRRLSLSIGIDAGYWMTDHDKARVRTVMGLEKSKFILLSSCRLNALKQIDKVIAVLERLRSEHDFLYIVTGHGVKEYEEYLRHLGKQLIADGKLKLVGQVSEEQLRNYYACADLFIMSSLAEAGPTATIKALAMELPVMSTDTGQMAEVLAKHGAGIIVPRKGYKMWEQELREILNGKKVKVLDREIVKKIHHWPYVAQQYIDLYRRLFEKYYGDNH